MAIGGRSGFAKEFVTPSLVQKMLEAQNKHYGTCCCATVHACAYSGPQTHQEYEGRLGQSRVHVQRKIEEHHACLLEFSHTDTWGAGLLCRRLLACR